MDDDRLNRSVVEHHELIRRRPRCGSCTMIPEAAHGNILHHVLHSGGPRCTITWLNEINSA